jgi:hypothetical protein
VFVCEEQGLSNFRVAQAIMSWLCQCFRVPAPIDQPDPPGQPDPPAHRCDGTPEKPCAFCGGTGGPVRPDPPATVGTIQQTNGHSSQA